MTRSSSGEARLDGQKADAKALEAAILPEGRRVFKTFGRSAPAPACMPSSHRTWQSFQSLWTIAEEVIYVRISAWPTDPFLKPTRT